ncbi:hypothetical protein K227x_19290 [Rubripirellula lacrimiformis]|uniref:Uncharacterized protein n=1 Tax=Rubripirellula lacrimiformis TaxID=1930273 RepID=A0A517N8S5_9BACT|nr:hypothetical protein K227x_19290 [Rubripirellula lacrimiformis]
MVRESATERPQSTLLGPLSPALNASSARFRRGGEGWGEGAQGRTIANCKLNNANWILKTIQQTYTHPNMHFEMFILQFAMFSGPLTQRR